MTVASLFLARLATYSRNKGLKSLLEYLACFYSGNKPHETNGMPRTNGPWTIASLVCLQVSKQSPKMPPVRKKQQSNLLRPRRVHPTKDAAPGSVRMVISHGETWPGRLINNLTFSVKQLPALSNISARAHTYIFDRLFTSINAINSNRTRPSMPAVIFDITLFPSQLLHV